MKKQIHLPTLLAMGLSAAAAGCGQAAEEQAAAAPPVSQYHASADTEIALNLPDQRNYPQGSGLRQSPGQGGLNDAAVDYGLALRTAAIKLNGRLPTNDEIVKMQAAIRTGASDGGTGDPSAVYKSMIQSFIAAPAFAGQMVNYWRNQFRMGQLTISGGFQGSTAVAMLRSVDLDTAPVLAARLTVEGKDITTMFTQATNNCPTFNVATNAFTDGNCFVAGVNLASPPTKPGNNIAEGQQAGVLTNPAFQAQYYSNMGFRRARVLQEIFACTRMPAEFAAKPEMVGSFVYSSPWPKDSIPNGTQPVLAARRYPGPAPTTTNIEYVAFSADCQNCHSTMNHRAALFGTFDAVGFSSGDYSKLMVISPVTQSPFTQMTEFFPAADKPAWRFGQPTATFQEFGTAMAKDPDVQRCFMTRLWNHAYSRDDVVNELALVPPQVTEETLKYFRDNGFNLKKTIEKVYTDTNFIRF